MRISSDYGPGWSDLDRARIDRVWIDRVWIDRVWIDRVWINSGSGSSTRGGPVEKHLLRSSLQQV